MAIFPLKKVAKLAGTHAVYLRGIACYNAGKVQNVTHPYSDHAAESIAGQVVSSDWESTYDVAVDFDHRGEAAHYSCTCKAFSRYDGACKHIVALLAYKYYHDMLGNVTTARQLMPVDDSNIAVKAMLDGFLDAAQTQLKAEALRADGAVSLVPTLTHALTCLTFTVGRTRQYVVRDITKFCEQMAQHATVTYGSQLTLLHHPALFDEPSRALYTFVCGCCARHAHIGRELPVKNADFDALFALYEGRRMAVANADGLPLSTLFLSADPTLTLLLRRNGNGLRLSIPDPPPYIYANRLYLHIGDTLYRCSDGMSRAIAPLLRAFWRREGGSLLLTQRDLGDFCASVLPQIGPYVRLEGDTDQLDAYRPQALDAQLYLDIPEPLVVTGRLEYHYGDQIFHPYGDEENHPATNRDKLGELKARLAAEQQFQTYQPDTGLMVTRPDEEDLYRFVTDGMAALSEAMTVFVSDAFRQARVVPPPRVSVGVGLSVDLLELDLDTGDMDAAEVAAMLAAYRRKKKYYRLRSGQFISLEDPPVTDLSRLTDGLDISDKQLQAGHATLPKYRALYLDGILRDSDNLPYQRDGAFRALVKSIKTVADSDYTPPASLEHILRHYQKVGFRWLKTMEQCGFGGILADDMGLGKTLQVIALLLDAREQGNDQPSLVVCPASLVLNWESEVRRFAPALTVLTVLGDADERAALIRRAGAYDVVITSYDLLKRDLERYQALTFRYHILDEAQYIKNHTTRNAQAVKSIRSRTRFALTGTPVENRLNELWSIFDFLMPGFLYSYSRFREQFELPALREDDREALERLRRLCAPFILRRLKKDVLRELPPKNETVLYTEMTAEQRKLYTATAMSAKKELAAAIAEQGAEKTRLQVLAVLTRLRQICCEPSLCFEDYHGGSAKMESCLELLREATETGHRVLLFSQFTSLLALLETALRREGIAFFTLQGSTPKEQRAAMVERFNHGDDDSPSVFLISLKAGGTGLNLTAADVVIHFDPWWNLAAQNQATDRAHRIGQKHSVQVYKLIAKDSVEEKILQLQEAKRDLADAVIREGDGLLTAMSGDDLLALLEI